MPVNLATLCCYVHILREHRGLSDKLLARIPKAVFNRICRAFFVLCANPKFLINIKIPVADQQVCRTLFPADILASRSDASGSAMCEFFSTALLPAPPSD